MNKKIFIPFLFFLLFACNNTKESSTDIEKLFDGEGDLLKGELIDVNGDEIGRLFDITLIDSLLILNSPTKDHVFKVINLSRNLLVTNFGKKGSGPGEIGFPSFIQKNPDDSTEILIFDKNRFNAYSLKIKDILNPNILPKRIVTKMDVNVQRAVRINNDRYLAYGIYENRFALLDSRGEFINSFVGYPYPDEYPNLTFSTLAMAFQGKLKTDLDGKRAIMATTQSANFDIVDLEDNNNPKHVVALHSWKPEFNDKSSGNSLGVAFTQENKYGYIDMTTNNALIYMLLSGRKRSVSGKNHRASKQVLVFDWLGNAITQYTLDREVSAIEINSSGTILYAYADDEPRLILKYAL